MCRASGATGRWHEGQRYEDEDPTRNGGVWGTRRFLRGALRPGLKAQGYKPRSRQAEQCRS